jgi:hypothetical protein
MNGGGAVVRAWAGPLHRAMLGVHVPTFCAVWSSTITRAIPQPCGSTLQRLVPCTRTEPWDSQVAMPGTFRR